MQDGVGRNSLFRGDLIDCLSNRKAASDARFGGRQVEQRLHQLDRQRMGRFRRRQDQNADALGEKVARRSANRHDVGDQSDLSVGTPHGKRSVRPDPSD
jgi:hypothetical protein